MKVLRLASGRRRSLLGRRGSMVAAAALLPAVALAAACGGEDKPAQEYFSQSDDVIRRLVPDASAFNLRLLSVGRESGTEVDFTVSTVLDGEPRLHIVSDVDAVVGAEPVEEYEGLSVYQKSATFWAELTAEPSPLYAGTPSEDGLKEYVDYYLSGEPELRDERFWDGFVYARERVSQALQAAPELLVVAFDGEWTSEAGGMRVEATLGDRQVYVGVLYAREDGQGGAEALDEETAAAFGQQFAVAAGAEEEPENPDWAYTHRIWFLDTGPGGGEE